MKIKLKSLSLVNEHDIVVNCTQQIEESVATTIKIYQGILDGLFKEDRKKPVENFTKISR